MSDLPFGNIFDGSPVSETPSFDTKQPVSSSTPSMSFDMSSMKEKDFKFDAIFNEAEVELGIGKFKRIVPIGEWLLDDPSVQALKRNLDDMGVTEVMPKVYANRVKHNIEKGYVTADGQGFTEKGQQRAAEYLQYRYNKSAEEATKRASEAKARPIDAERVKKVSTKKLALKFAFGYQLDSSGRAIIRH